eukprot:c4621_g1_i1.p1 GENE.c4621_g1_i1~~c4621_g1_i1.p1  ORF type:complete len:961 (-),score=273.19 c4621_g1_i1:1016-3592(-)
MQNPTSTTVEMTTFLQMSAPNGQMFDSHLESTVVNIGTVKDGDFGYMTLPLLHIHSSSMVVNATSTVVVTDVKKFTAATAAVLQGRPTPWTISGKPKLNLKLLGAAMKYNLDLSKQFDLPTTLFVQMQAYNVSIQSTNKTSVVSHGTSSFFSSSVLELRNIGRLLFELYNEDQVLLGTVEIPEFRAYRDFNLMDGCSVVMTALPDGSNVKAINKLLFQFASGNDQNTILRGPIESVAPFLSHIVTQNVTIKGARAVSNVQAKKMAISASTEDSISAIASVSMYSDLPLKISAIAIGEPKLTLELVSNDVVIGECFLDKDVQAGLNEMDLESVIKCDSGDDSCKRAAQNFLSVFASGGDQTLTVRGPVKHPNPFVNGILESSMVVYGAKAIESVVANGFSILSTNSTHLQSTCNIQFVSYLPINISAVGGSLVFQLVDESGTLLGESTVSTSISMGLNVLKNVPTVLFLNDDQSNLPNLKNFMKTLSNGLDQNVAMTGPVRAITPLLENTMSAKVLIQGAVMLKNVESYDLSPTSGTATQLAATMTTAFDTDIAVALGGLGGPVKFKLSDSNLVELGEVVMDVEISVGHNVKSATSTLIKTADNVAALSELNGNFLSRQDQTIVISGPTGSVAPFLDDLVTLNAVLRGIDTDLVGTALVDSESLGGTNVQVDGKSITIRGTKLNAINKFPVQVTQSNMRLNVSLHQPLAYTFSHMLLGTHECPTTTALSTQVTMKGMFKDNPDQDYLVSPPNSIVSFLSPSQPQPSQAVQETCYAAGIFSVGLPCCFMTAVPAAACRALNTYKENFIRLKTQGTVTVAVEDFVLDVAFTQENTPLMYDIDVTSGFVADLKISCDDFKYH